MDAIFKALSDPARRTLLDALREKDGQTLLQLQEHLDMTRFGVMKHLAVLEEATLITTIRRGRFKYHYLNAVPLQQVIDRWIEPLVAKPSARGLLSLKASLEGTSPMPDQKPDFVHQTFIRTTQDNLWDALTRADQMAAYHFACDVARGDAAPGGVTEYLLPDGSLMLTQRTLSITPKSRIEMSFEPAWAPPGTPSSRVVFTVAPEGDICRLTTEHYGLTPGMEGVAEGWARWTASLKSWLETGTAIKAPMGNAA